MKMAQSFWTSLKHFWTYSVGKKEQNSPLKLSQEQSSCVKPCAKRNAEENLRLAEAYWDRCDDN